MQNVECTCKRRNRDGKDTVKEQIFVVYSEKRRQSVRICVANKLRTGTIIERKTEGNRKWKVEG